MVLRMCESQGEGTAGGHFTQPRDHSLAEPGTSRTQVLAPDLNSARAFAASPPVERAEIIPLLFIVLPTPSKEG